MSHPDWSKAPEWARVVGKAGVSGFLVWTDHKKYSYMNGDFGGREFIIGDPCTWRNDEIEVVDTRPTSQEWNGTGRPPVGTVCEWRPNNGGWMTITILGHDGSDTWYRDSDGHADTVRNIAFLRPVRTQEQIAAEEREAAVNDMHDLYIQGAKHHGGLYAIYDAGYRRQSTCDPTGHDD